MVESYTDAVVVVSGACGGIGEAIARSFAAAGATLGLCDIRAAELDQLADELRQSGSAVYHKAIDVTDTDAVSLFCSSASEELQGINHLVSTVGIVDIAGDVVGLPLEAWNRALSVNLTSAFLLAKYTVPHMVSAGGGSIVNISSVSGYANQAGAMAYSVTKAGLISLTKSQAIDLARHNIRSNVICPGSVDTPLVDIAAVLTAEETGRTAEETRKDWESQYPTGRFSQPQEVAELALFLCSERAANATGASFVIDGGLRAVLPER